MRITMLIATAASLLAWQPATATEPNENFESATLLGPGVLTVSDELRQPSDTLLGTRGLFDDIQFVDDDGSPVGNGFASGIADVPTNSGSISFAVTGYTDESFSGAHDQLGTYEVFVQPYDFFGDAIDGFTVTQTMQPSVVDEFDFFDADWIGGSYDVYIDNLVEFEGFADIDFYTFTGLTAGASFTAETLDPSSSGVDTLLGWFSAGGALLESDDSGGSGALNALIDGVVPANGQLTFAVTGPTDTLFEGEHQSRGAYDLKLTLGGGVDYAADFNNDGKVNSLDLVAWKTAFGATPVGDADNDNDSDGADFLVWQRQFGSGVASVAAATAVPEPATGALLFSAVMGVTAIGRLRQPPR
ncbi:MAG: hypothetical protein C0485_01350 [Pirellula sp.]|nr:hypothetical protein [Pirellula sp.]